MNKINELLTEQREQKECLPSLCRVVTEEDYSQYKRAAEYVASQCTGCSDSPMILAIKAYNCMVEAEGKGNNPYKALNDFLGTNIPEAVLKNL